MTQITPAERARVRALFPALKSEWTFFENAGGSQVPQSVIDSVQRYYTDYYVQLGAGYPRSDRATALVDLAHEFVGKLLGAGDGAIVLGSSTTSLLYTISDAYAKTWVHGDEIVIAETGHEANIGPWLRLAEQGAEIRWWKIRSEARDCVIEDLDPLLTEKTRLVIVPHVSNLLGDVLDLREVSRRAHAVRAEVVADGVAYAPHQVMDMQQWDVDWYVYSTYKVYGPHMAAIYGKRSAIDPLTGPNHFFIPNDEVPYKFELGGASHEGCAAILGLADYLLDFTEADRSEAVGTQNDKGTGTRDVGESAAHITRPQVTEAFRKMEALEAEPKRQLVEFLDAHPRVTLVGSNRTDSTRVGTVSFLHDSLSPEAIVAAAHERKFAIRSGHMYAYRLCQALGIPTQSGVVRVSLVHYNTPDEVEGLIEVLDSTLR